MPQDETGVPAGLHPYDDLPVHQHADLLARPAVTRWNFTERWYFNIQAPAGELLGLIGGGIYRNTGLSESYLCVLIDGVQHNYRTTRNRDNCLGLSDGFAKFTIDEPLAAWRIGARDEDLGIDIALRFESANAPFLYQTFWVGPDRGSDDYDQYEHFVQPGRLAGTAIVAGSSVLDGQALSFRDRTWGVRSRRPRLHNWIVLHLDDGSHVTLVHQESASGHVLYTHAGRTFGGGRVELFEIDQHDLRFDGVSRVPVAGSFALHGRAGDCELLLEPIGAESIRGIGAGYDAGQGKGRADSAPTAHSTIDLADATAVEQAGRGTIDTPVRCTFTGPSGETRGLGVWETALGRSHYRYGSQVAAR